VIDDPDLTIGFLDEALRAEFPELALVYTPVEARPRRTPREVRARLREASNRFTGAKAVALRQQPVPWAYRVFFRHVGIDPDEQRTPVEAIALERMRAGGFQSRSLLDDALLLATLETSVPVQAFDADKVEGELGLRLAHPSERLGDEGRLVPSGQLVIADSRRSLAVLFGDVAPEAAVAPSTRRMLVTALRVKGVPDVSVEEAIWIAVDILTYQG
jgi:DNA/RNA-binding domain of Phe-tRNA-synthetase-like protein